MSEENVEIVRNAFAAFERGDIEGLLRLCDEDIVITQPPDLPGVSPEQRGHRGVLEALAIWPEQWDEYRTSSSGLMPRLGARCSSPSGAVDAESRAGSRSIWTSASSSPSMRERSASGACSCRKSKPWKPPGCRSSSGVLVWTNSGSPLCNRKRHLGPSGLSNDPSSCKNTPVVLKQVGSPDLLRGRVEDPDCVFEREGDADAT
jgi:hypothetical protein